MIKVILLIFVLGSLSGCAKSQEIKNSCVKYPFVISSEVKPVSVRVHKDDIDRYVTYVEALRVKSDEYERQIGDYLNRWCEDGIVENRWKIEEHR